MGWRCRAAKQSYRSGQGKRSALGGRRWEGEEIFARTWASQHDNRALGETTSGFSTTPKPAWSPLVFILKLFKKGIILPYLCNAQHKGVGEIDFSISATVKTKQDVGWAGGLWLFQMLIVSFEKVFPLQRESVFPTAEELVLPDAACTSVSDGRCYLRPQARSRGDRQGTAGCCL